MIRYYFEVQGIVQGVGFRPFLYRLALFHHLTGWVRNTAAGVEGEVEGEETDVLAYLSDMKDSSSVPSQAMIEKASSMKLNGSIGFEAFSILNSREGRADTLVSPDIGICDDCLRELNAPDDRRFRYPFINCTNCGPRFTIVKSVPYDRPRTAMADFTMCDDCAAEYADPLNRRYHAQPDCCSVCGPQLSFLDGHGIKQAGDPIEQACRLLENGGILAVKGLGGFHLACLTDEETVLKLRARKRREERPLAVMARSMEDVYGICKTDAAEEAALNSAARPIVLLKKKDTASLGHLSINASLGVMLPYTPLHVLLMKRFPYLVMTSANPSSLPAVINNDEAVSALQGIADAFLVHDRDIVTRCDDSLLRMVNGESYFIRRSRGYAPAPIRLNMEAKGILALGAEQKASFAIGKADRAFYSQHIGDLKNAETFEHYTQQIDHFKALFDLKPVQVVCDLHPEYLSARYAVQSGLPMCQVQHHHAHMASCMADNGLDGECIGIIWDGTGLGSDNTIWGGEFLSGGYRTCERRASIRPVKLPGGDAAIHQIGRIADAVRADCGLPCEDALTSILLQKGINCPVSSGMGRLFDAVYSLLTGKKAVSYEGQAAEMLEALAEGSCTHEALKPMWLKDGDILRYDWRSLVLDLISREDKAEAARVFHNSLIEMAREACLHIRSVTGLDRVVLSGGVFFNMILLEGITTTLESEGFTVYHHHRVSTGDEGIALGQLAICAKQNEKED